MKVRNALNFRDTKFPGFRTVGPSRTKQEFKEESDINVMVRRFGITGALPQGVRLPEYGDFTGVGSFHEACNAIAAAHESFSAMPADVRKRFGNNPGEFVDFCNDPKNVGQLAEWGLTKAPLPSLDPRTVQNALQSTQIGEPKATPASTDKTAPATS